MECIRGPDGVVSRLLGYFDANVSLLIVTGYTLTSSGEVVCSDIHTAVAFLLTALKLNPDWGQSPAGFLRWGKCNKKVWEDLSVRNIHVLPRSK